MLSLQGQNLAAKPFELCLCAVVSQITKMIYPAGRKEGGSVGRHVVSFGDSEVIYKIRRQERIRLQGACLFMDAGLRTWFLHYPKVGESLCSNRKNAGLSEAAGVLRWTRRRETVIGPEFSCVWKTSSISEGQINLLKRKPNGRLPFLGIGGSLTSAQVDPRQKELYRLIREKAIQQSALLLPTSDVEEENGHRKPSSVGWGSWDRQLAWGHSFDQWFGSIS